MKRILSAILVWILISVSSYSKAQCPAVLTVTVASINHASCPDNGSVTLGGTGVGNSAVTYKIVSGPSHVGMEQSSNIFSSLSAGTYIFRAICNSQSADVAAIIFNLYTPLSTNFSVNVSNVCGNYTPGGTITVSGVSGGRAPYQYSFIANPSANYNESLSVYSLTPTYNTTAWGTYQVRVKDACGTFVTKTIQLQPTYPAATFGDGSVNFENVSCDSAMLDFWMANDGGDGVGLGDYPSLKFKIYEKQAASCAKGALIKTLDLTSSDWQSIVIPKRDVYIEITTPCGDVRGNCYNYPDNDSLATHWMPVIHGCGTPSNPATVTIQHMWTDFGKPPLTAKLYNNATGVLLDTRTLNNSWDNVTFTGLAVAPTYKIIVSDLCGKKDTVLVTAPTSSASIAPVDAGTRVEQGCSYTDGKTTVQLQINGYVANLDTSGITITSGPDNIGMTAHMNDEGLFLFHDLTPGATYGFTIYNGCSPVTLSFKVPSDDYLIVTSKIHPVATQQCGGTGTINANFDYRGWGNYHIELWKGSTMISTNNSGTFTNVAPGLYNVKAIMEQTWCEQINATIADTVRVFADGTPPVVSRKIGYACENNGVPLTTGTLYIETLGFGPYIYNIKRILPNPEAAYTTVASNAPGNYTFTGLTANATYSVQIIDNCGKSTVTEAVIGDLGALSFTSLLQPCAGSAYILSAPYFPGATYNWVKDGSNVSLSQSSILSFLNYNSSYDGRYFCTIIFPGGCLQRVMAAELRSGFCGFVLPVNLISFDAKAANCKTLITWKVANNDAKGFEVEKSTDGQHFFTLGYIASQTSGADSYSYTDYATGTKAYYRLKMIYAEKPSYSNVVSVSSDCTEAATTLAMYPNPAKQNTVTLEFTSEMQEQVAINIMNNAGLTVAKESVSVTKGINRHKLDISSLPAGIYMVHVTGKLYNKTVKLIKQ